MSKCSDTFDIGEPSQLPMNKLTANQRFCCSDFIAKRGFGQDGSGDSKNVFRIAFLRQLTMFAVSLFMISLLWSVVVDLILVDLPLLVEIMN